MKTFVSWFLGLALLVGASPAQAQVFPLLGGLVATLSFIHLSGSKGAANRVGPVYPNHKVPGYTGPSRMKYQLYKVSGEAPLVFLITGLGGDERSEQSGYLADWLNSEGFHVVVLGSTFRDEFAHVNSNSPYVGQARVDSHALYTKMVSIRQQLQKQKLAISGFALVGYSFGGLLSAYMARLDHRERYFNFKKVILINPPVDLLYSMQQVDLFYAEFQKRSFPERGRLLLRYANYLRDMARSPFSPSRHQQAIVNNQLSDRDLKALIGYNFHRTLKDVVFYTQQVVDVGVIPMGLSQERRRHAGRFNFTEYVSQLMLAYYTDTLEGRHVWQRFYGSQHPVRLDFLNHHNSLYGVESFLKRTDKVSVFHTEDDFLINSQDLLFLRRTFNQRLYLFSAGGHLGNFWFPPFRQAFIRQLHLAF